MQLHSDLKTGDLGLRKRVARLLLKKVVVDKKKDVTVHFATTNVYRLDGAGGSNTSKGYSLVVSKKLRKL